MPCPADILTYPARGVLVPETMLALFWAARSGCRAPFPFYTRLLPAPVLALHARVVTHAGEEDNPSYGQLNQSCGGNRIVIRPDPAGFALVLV
jgi:hypothetical protein